MIVVSLDNPAIWSFCEELLGPSGCPATTGGQAAVFG